MAFTPRTLLALLFFMAVAIEFSHGAVYKVGDSAGWTTIGNVDYKQWGATKNFDIGDVIRFEYNAQFHNVMRVTHGMYKTCNTSAPMATYTTGNDSITIKTRGHHFFFCGVPGHCQAGQKVDINVLNSSALAPTPAAPTSPAVPSVEAPGPSPNNAPSLKPSMALLHKLGFAVFAITACAFV
ncbi:copper binding protein 7 [Tripterygium wilfordii]|uniref:Copper binding protein 7 n=1 Tax=Tripterygium wilfordii TaxID=458696 RepID=A0A7J7CRY1_TRIWF|nr:mavicyanin-like [Tripterygium wilfordii]KAF5736853.1 copper binding protein 7 [Tripterygium wilfordii]